MKDPVDLFKGVKKILNTKGIFILEFPYLKNIYMNCQFDNIFHEHIGFHSLKSIIDICDIVELKLIDVKIIESQGGSLRVTISKDDKLDQSANIAKILKKEQQSKIYNIESWKKFNKQVFAIKNQIIKILKKIKKENKVISIYGASGKGQTLLQFLGDANKYFDKVYDKSKLKINLYTPGTHIKIYQPKDIITDMPDYLFVCSWNLLKEIQKEQIKYIKKGGKFITPFPTPKII